MGAGWDRVVGQDRAVALLRRAAERPTHAYLLVGPRGSGVEEAARCFAAAVIAGDDERAWDLALRGVHPDVVEIDPAANQIRLEDAQRILDEAYRSPVEGVRKAILVFEAERLNEQAANKLLKTLEEPPASALIVLVTAGADQLLATIRSRCQRVDFAYLGTSAIAGALRGSGVDEERAELLAGLAGGQVDRARALGGRLAPVRDAFVDAATTSDGTGSHVALHVARAQETMQAALADLEDDQASELLQLTGDLEASGYPDRVVRAQLRRLEEKQKRGASACARRAADRGDHGGRDRVPRRAGGPIGTTAQRRPAGARARGAIVQPCARRMPRRAAGDRRVQPQRDAPRRAPLPPPARGRRRHAPM